MKVVKKPLSELHSPERNVRLHTDKQLKEFRRFVEMFGQIRPIVVDEGGMILAGNGLLEAMRSMGRTEADCYVVTGLTEAQKKKLMLADNRVFNLGVDDMEALLAGAKFQWWCIEVKHFNCLNQLSNDESFICWDSRKAAQWVRQPPPFALRNHPKLRPRVDSYQTFLPRVTMDGIMLSGVRASESVQRLQYMSALNMGLKGMTESNTIYAAFAEHTHDVVLTPWLPRVNDSVLTLYLPMDDSDGYILGRIEEGTN